MRILNASLFENLWRKTQNPDVDDPTIPFIRFLLWLLVPVYWFASRTKRGFFYLFPYFRTRVSALTVSIGNLSVGGTGKTTTARLLAEMLSNDLDLETVVLSRGYRSDNDRWILPVSRKGEILVSAKESGDEASLLARWLGNCSVIVGRRRAITARWAVKEWNAQAILLDDALQYWRLERDLDFVTIAATGSFDNDFLFPRGSLRESLSELKRADCVILYQADLVDPERLHQIMERVRFYNPNVAMIKLNLCLEANVLGSDGSRKGIDLRGKRVLAFCALGSPSSFAKSIESKEARLLELLTFPDHHRYGLEDLEKIRSSAEELDAEYIVTTEKDEANLQSGLGPLSEVCIMSSRPSIAAKDKRVIIDLLRRAGK